MIVHLFEWETYYPSGGWNDHAASFGDVDAVFAHMSRVETHEQDRPADNAQIVVDGVAHSRWSRSVVFAGSPPRDADDRTRWDARPEEWTYPADGSRWLAGAWELEAQL